METIEYQLHIMTQRCMELEMVIQEQNERLQKLEAVKIIAKQDEEESR